MTKRYPVAVLTLALFVVFDYIGITLVYGAINAAQFGVRESVEVAVGMSFVVIGLICFAVSMTCFLARSDEKASRSLRWLGSLRPKW